MEKEKKSNIRNLVEWIISIIIAIILALLVRYFIGTPTIVKHPSMYPTLKENQRLILNRWSITTKEEIKRGEIVTFEAPTFDKKHYTYLPIKDTTRPVAVYQEQDRGFFGDFIYYVLEWGKESYIKRVIGLPGEKIQIKDGKVYVNGQELREDYLQPNVTTQAGEFSEFIVPEGTLFVMGDNRSHSTDSREFGCIPIEKLESKVWIRFWPFDLFGKVD